MKKIKINLSSFPKILFILSLCFLFFTYGFLTFPFKWFPYELINNAIKYIDEKINKPEELEYYVETNLSKMIPIYDESYTYNGLSLVTSIIKDNRLSARVIDMDGDLIHEWQINWFDLWADVKHIPDSDPRYPKSLPGTLIHGAVLLDNGDLIFNFSSLGMVRIDVCGNIVWRLPYRTHHSIYLDEHGNLWAPGLIWHEDPHPHFPNLTTPFDELTILKISLDGKVLNEIFIFELLRHNGLEGLLYLSGYGDNNVDVSGDPVHLNDIDIFPSSLEEGIFKTGDIMISLRNINTVLVFREEDLIVTHVSTGMFVRQHDPDFINGNTFSVFDNFSIAPKEYGNQSRILIRSLDKRPNEQNEIYYSGSEQHPFYSPIIGNHQWLPNGNLLIVESTKGRAFEIDQQGEIVWEFVNLVGNGYAGWVTDVQRLPGIFTEEYLSQLTENCKAYDSD